MRGIRMFFGVEAEGRWRGVPTVFVPIVRDRNLTDRDDEYAIRESFQGRHIYLGAGGSALQSQEDFCHAKVLIDHNPQCCFTVEIAFGAVALAAKFLVFNVAPNVRFFLSASAEHADFVKDFLPACEFKVDHDGGCVVFQQAQQHLSDDPLYAQDKII